MEFGYLSLYVYYSYQTETVVLLLLVAYLNIRAKEMEGYLVILRGKPTKTKIKEAGK